MYLRRLSSAAHIASAHHTALHVATGRSTEQTTTDTTTATNSATIPRLQVAHLDVYKKVAVCDEKLTDKEYLYNK